MANRNVPVPTPAPRGLLGTSAPATGGLLGGIGDFFSSIGDGFSDMRDNNPDFLTGIGIGLMKGDVAGGMEWGAAAARERKEQEAIQAYRQQTLAQDASQFDRTYGLQEREFGARQSLLASDAQQKRVMGNRTAQVLRDWGPEFEPYAAMAEAGFATDAFNEAAKLRANGGKPPELESIFDADGREQKGYFKGRDFVPVGGAKALDGGGLGTPPSGFMWGPNDQSRLAPIPGGPGEQIPGELAARVGLADNFLSQVPDLLDKVKSGAATGPIDRMVGGSVSGSSQAEVMRGLQSGTDALMRMLTGAGMNQTEAEAYAKRYLPTYTDNAASAAQKVQQLDAELRTIREKVMQGRGGTGGGAGRGSGNDYRNRYGLE